MAENETEDFIVLRSIGPLNHTLTEMESDDDIENAASYTGKVSLQEITTTNFCGYVQYC